MAASQSSIVAGRGHVVLGVDKSPLQRGLQSASEEFKAWGSRIIGTGIRVAAIGALIAAPFIASFHHFVEAGSELQDMADRTGLAVEALQELKHAAEQSGSSAEDLEKGLKAMDQFLVNVAAGAPAALDSLDRLGLRFDEINQLTREERFHIFADAIAGIDNASMRTALVLDVFGRTGMALLPLLRAGSSGIRELREEARRLGLVMAAEDVAAAEALGDQLANLMKIAKAMAFQIGASVAPLIKVMVDAITQAAIVANHWIQQHRELARWIFAVGIGVAIAGAAIVVLGGIVWAVGGAFGVLWHTLMEIEHFFGMFTAATGGVGLALLQYSSALVGHFVPILKHVAHAFLAVRLSLLAATIASWVWAQVVAGSVAAAATASAFYGVVLTTISSGFGVLTLATWAWSIASTTAIGIANAALAIFGATIGLIKGMLTGFGALQAVIWVGATTKALIASAALAVYAAATGPASGGSLMLAIAEGIASIATTILTSGINLLIGAVVIFAGVFTVAAAAVGLFALAVVSFVPAITAVGVGISYLMARVEDLFDGLDRMTQAFIDFGAEVLNDPFGKLLESATEFYEFVSGKVLAIWETISNAVDEANEAFAASDLSDFATYLFYAAAGAAGLAIGLAYFATELPGLWAEGMGHIRDGLAAVFEWLMSGNLLEMILVAVEDALGEVVEVVAGVINEIGDLAGEIFGFLARPFIAAADFIGGILRTVTDFAVETVLAIARWFVELTNMIARPFIDLWQWWVATFDEAVAEVVNLFRRAFNAIADIVQTSLSGFREFFEELLYPVAVLGRNLVGAILEAMTGIRDSIGQAARDLAAGFSDVLPSIRVIGTAAASAASSTWGAFTHVLADIADNFSRTFGGTWNAIQSQNWELAWDIIRASAALLWHDISVFAVNTFNEWKSAGTIIFYRLGDILKDAFEGAWLAVVNFFDRSWTELRVLFSQGWTFIETGFWNIALEVIRAWGAVHNFIRDSIRQIVGALGVNVANMLGLNNLEAIQQGARDAVIRERNLAIDRGGQEVANIRNQGEGGAQFRAAEADVNRIVRQMEREQRDQEIRDLQERIRAAAAAGNEAERAQLDWELQHLIDQAEELAVGADPFFRLPALPGRDAFAPKLKTSIGGGMSFGEILGSIGASAREDPMARLARLEQRQIDLLEEVRRGIRDVERVAGARIG